MKKGIMVLASCFLILGLSYYFYTASLHESSYLGLPTVPCFDTTKPIKQNYSFTIKIFISGKNLPLNKSIGHDFGNCLHIIYVHDESGKVFITANDINTYTLGQFFDVWHKTFNNYQMGNYIAKQKIRVQVNGKDADETNIRTIPLLPNSSITIFYD